MTSADMYNTGLANKLDITHMSIHILMIDEIKSLIILSLDFKEFVCNSIEGILIYLRRGVKVLKKCKLI